MVIGRDSRSEGRRFEYRYCILDGHFFTYFKNCNDVCLKRPKINEKEAGVGHFERIQLGFGKILNLLRLILYGNWAIFHFCN